MTLNYNLTEEDYIDFNLFHYNNSPKMKKQNTRQLVAIPVLFFILGTLYVVFTKPDSILAPLIICILGTVVWVLAYPFFVKRELKKQVVTLMKEGKKDELVGEYTLTINEDGIHEKNHARSVKSDYDIIEKISMDDKHLYIYNGPMSAFMVPHTAFKSTEEEDETVAYIKEMAGLKYR